MNFFMPHTSYSFTTSFSSSANNVKGSSCFATNLAWLLTGSTLTPKTVALASSNEAMWSRILRASFVQPGVASLG